MIECKVTLPSLPGCEATSADLLCTKIHDLLVYYMDVEAEVEVTKGDFNIEYNDCCQKFLVRKISELIEHRELWTTPQLYNIEGEVHYTDLYWEEIGEVLIDELHLNLSYLDHDLRVKDLDHGDLDTLNEILSQRQRQIVTAKKPIAALELGSDLSPMFDPNEFCSEPIDPKTYIKY